MRRRLFKKSEPVTVILAADVLAVIERIALDDLETRTVVIRHLIDEALEARGHER